LPVLIFKTHSSLYFPFIRFKQYHFQKKEKKNGGGGEAEEGEEEDEEYLDTKLRQNTSTLCFESHLKPITKIEPLPLSHKNHKINCF
jgi:hypothetical protein